MHLSAMQTDPPAPTFFDHEVDLYHKAEYTEQSVFIFIQTGNIFPLRSNIQKCQNFFNIFLEFLLTVDIFFCHLEQ
jgi:hypothetical protein